MHPPRRPETVFARRQRAVASSTGENPYRRAACTRARVLESHGARLDCRTEYRQDAGGAGGVAAKRPIVGAWCWPCVRAADRETPRRCAAHDSCRPQHRMCRRTRTIANLGFIAAIQARAHAVWLADIAAAPLPAANKRAVPNIALSQRRIPGYSPAELAIRPKEAWLTLPHGSDLG